MTAATAPALAGTARKKPVQTVLEPLSNRQLAYAPTSDRRIRVLPRTMQRAETIAPHKHPWHQLAFAIEGAVRLNAEQTAWIAPVGRAIWTPANMVHSLQVLERTQLRTVNLHHSLMPRNWTAHGSVIQTSPLMLALLDEMHVQESFTGTRTRAHIARERLVHELFIDEVQRAPQVALHVAMPTERRLLKLCEHIIQTPDEASTMVQLAPRFGLSARTVNRLFHQELGMRYTRWREQVTLTQAVVLLSKHVPITQVAARLGYSSTSAFSAMFKQALGISPSQMF